MHAHKHICMRSRYLETVIKKWCGELLKGQAVIIDNTNVIMKNVATIAAKLESDENNKFPLIKNSVMRKMWTKIIRRDAVKWDEFFDGKPLQGHLSGYLCSAISLDIIHTLKYPHIELQNSTSKKQSFNNLS